MPPSSQPHAPDGDLTRYTREVFDAEGEPLTIYRRGQGPAVLVITEMPGISPQVVGFADLVVGIGCTAVLPQLFGKAGSPYAKLSRAGRGAYALRSLAQVCIRREFSLFAAGRSSPIVSRLRALSAHEHERCGGPGVGVIGMCFTGGFALAMAVDPWVLAPVLSQPSLPVMLTGRQRASIDCEPDKLAAVAARCAQDGLEVLGLRFVGDPYVSDERFSFLQEKLGDGFVRIELPQSAGHPQGPLPHRHSVLTGDLIDRQGEPTHDARERVLALFRKKLLAH
ncbi:MAG: hypothetical protein JWN48_3037 [Myxococcaceae bacterium]|nr:hypothetical protein [Myxococcaceae bacterium]